MEFTPIILEGRHVRLEPLTADHADRLMTAVDEDLWKWTTGSISDSSDMQRYIERAGREQVEGQSLPFATIHRESGRAVGCTRFAHISVENRRVEIGYTWIGKPWQRTAVNTEAKYLMLKHAFETQGCIRVELVTDVLNERSRAAIHRIGATQEGILRNHKIVKGGRIRDTVQFSIITSEWPEVKRKLELKLEDPNRGGKTEVS